MSSPESVNQADRTSVSTLRLPTLAGPIRWTLGIQRPEGLQTVPLERRLTIGSSQRADIVLEDATVSATHCELHPTEAAVYVRDLESKNGTLVSGARIREAWVRSGTSLGLGRAWIVVDVVEAKPPPSDEPPLLGLAGDSPIMRELARHVRRLAKLGMPVLISGETGTGKELIAHALHEEGPRRRRPFIAINVASLPRELVESELFGHERGAFTGATQRRAGAFVEAENGTLFLDEVGELPMEAQPKLLRVLDGYGIRSLGGNGSRKPDVRVVAATHVPLAQLVERGTFRRDLFHRLEVFTVRAPSLWERRGDIPALVGAILAKHSAEFERSRWSPEATLALATHDWPGNVRQLRNVVFRALAAATQRVVTAADVQDAMGSTCGSMARELDPHEAARIFAEAGQNWSLAARRAGVPRTTFRRCVDRAKRGQSR